MGNSTVRLLCHKNQHRVYARVKMSLLSSAHDDALILRFLHDIIWHFIYIISFKVLLLQVLML